MPRKEKEYTVTAKGEWTIEHYKRYLEMLSRATGVEFIYRGEQEEKEEA